MGMTLEELMAEGGKPLGSPPEASTSPAPKAMTLEELQAEGAKPVGTPVATAPEQMHVQALGNTGFFKSPQSKIAYPSPAEHQESAPATSTGNPKSFTTIPQDIHAGAMRLGEGYMQRAKQARAAVGKPISPGEEAGMRAFGAGIVGDDLLKQENGDEGLQQLKSTFGETGSSAVLAGLQTLGAASLMAVPGAGLSETGAEAGAALASSSRPLVAAILKGAGGLAGSAAEGALMGGAQALISGEDVGHAVKSGAVIGAGFHALGAGAGALLRKRATAKAAASEAKVFAQVPPGEMTALADEIATFDTGRVAKNTQEAAMGVGSEFPNVDAVKVRPGTPGFEPSIVTAVKKTDGEVWARYVEFKAGKPPRFYDVPMSTPHEVLQVGQQLSKIKDRVGFSPSTDAFQTISAWPHEMFSALYNPPDLSTTNFAHLGARQAKAALTEPPRSSRAMGPGRNEPTVAARPVLFAPGEIDTPSLPGGSTKPTNRPSLDTPPVDPIPLHHVVSEEAGHIRVEPLDIFAVHKMPDSAPNEWGQPYRPELARKPVEIPTVNEKAPKATPPEGVKPERGQLLYMPKPEGGFDTVKMIGPSTKAGEVLVKADENSAPFPVALARLRSDLPPGAAVHADVIPLSVPEPPAPSLQNVSPEQLQEAGVIKRVTDYMSRQASNSTLLKKLLPGHLRGPKDLAMLAQMAQGVQALQKTESEALLVLKKSLPRGELLSDVDKSLAKVGEGKMSWVEFRKTHGDQITDQAQQVVQKFLDERTADDERLAKEFGVVPENFIKERENGAKDAYLARFYLRNLVGPDRWLKHTMETDLFDNAVQFITKQLKDRGEYWLPSEIAAQMTDILKSADMEGTLKASKLGQSPVFKRLMARGDIPGPIRKVMGEVESGVLRMAVTYGTQKALLAQHTLMRSIAQNLEWSNIGPRPDLHPQPVPAVRRMYGDLAGMYVKPEIYENVINLPVAVQNGNALLRGFQNFLKGNQLMSAGPVLNSLVGNFQASILHGGIDPFLRPDKAGVHLWRVNRAIRDFQNDPTGKTGLGSLILEAKKMGIDWAGHAEVEVSPKSRKLVEELSKTLDLDKGASLPDHVASLGKWMMHKYRDGQDALLGAALDYPDRLFRLANYYGLKEKLLAKGIPTDQAMQTAARRTAETFWNPSHMGQIPDQTAKMVGFAAPYARAAFEEFRVLSAVPRRLTEEPDLKWRLGANALVAGALWGANGLMRQMNGIPDEVMKYSLDAMTKAHQTNSPFIFVPAWHDDKGRIQHWDVSNYFMPLKFFQGSPDDAMWQKVLSNFIKMPVNGGLGEDAVNPALTAIGLQSPPPTPPKPGTGEAGLMKGLEYMWRIGVAPRVAQTALDVARNTGVAPDPFTGRQVGRNEEQLTPGEAIARSVGLPQRAPVTVDPNQPNKEFIASAIEFKRQEGDLMNEARSVAASTLTPEAKKARLAAIFEAVKKISAQRQEVNASQQQAFQAQGGRK